ncbi:hypothetical protein GCM10009651_36490 [Microbacterium natoriense]
MTKPISENASAEIRRVPQVEIDNITHNLWRYNELQKLRLGQSNLYLESSYR